MTIKALVCPRCGSPDLEELTWNRRRCRHCGTESVLSSDRTRLQLVEWVCPSCGFNNESGTAFCGQCGAKLTKKCPECGNQIRIDLQFCSFCGANYGAISAERIRQRRAEGIARLEESRKARVGKLRRRAIWTGCATWFVLYTILASPVMLLVEVRDNETMFFLLAYAAIIVAIPAAIWFARRKRSQWLESMDQDLASKRQSLEEALAEE